MQKVCRKLWRHCVVHGFMRLFNTAGSRFYLAHRPDFATRLDREEMHRLFQLWEHGQKGNNRGDWTRLFFLIANVESLMERAVPGAIAELGVYKGATAKILNMLAPERSVYLFDTFSGFDERDVKNDPSGTRPGRFNGSLDEVKQFVGTDAQVHYCKGVFPDTVSMVPNDERFALVHLDCDLYEPTKAACEFFYKRLLPGGLLILHDYYSGCWPGVRQAVDEFLGDKPETLTLIPDKSGTAVLTKTAIKGRAFR